MVAARNEAAEALANPSVKVVILRLFEKVIRRSTFQEGYAGTSHHD
jgi:hypothetical protein